MDRTVCIVEGDADMRDVLARIVRSVGLTPEFCASVKSFLNLRDRSGIGCLLIDSQPDSMSDGALLDALVEGGTDIPVFLISGSHDANASAAAQRLGALIIGKPFDAHLLARRIRTAVTSLDS